MKLDVSSLYQKSNRTYALALLRVIIGVFLIRKIFFNITSGEILYGSQSFVAHENIFFLGFIEMGSWIREFHAEITFVFSILCVFMIFGIGKRLTIFFIFLLFELFQRMNGLVLNGGDNLMKFILLYLIFADSFQYFVLKKVSYQNQILNNLNNLFTRLSAYSILIHLCLAYFVSGIFKLHSDVWFNGVASYYTLSLERFQGTPFNEQLAQNGYFITISTYGTLFLELYFPVLIWIKKIRYPLMVAGILLHLSIFSLMMIYDFQFVFIMAYCLFLTNKEWEVLTQRLKSLKFAGKWKIRKLYRI
ncbi:HTTM domain-containing protein [Marivirga sp. S37H4]|uniref:HTTM domain-containing protein n=1 Tax=Marivirga aurantiaca TaxID=2802615 RepID=A0A934X1S4_9BACT|nr:HTTM domain-containing protein [Marivirga aurantiaca]MBK6267413.1 HTTM domain-containing protein [Marivirga aurantiaca]